MSRTTTAISIPQLRADLTGRVVAPRDADYDAQRTIFYGGIDSRPAAIVMTADAADVSRVVELARETGLELAVRSGGHSIPGHSTNVGGVVIDLRDLNGLEIDVESRTAWAETGLTTGGYTDAAAEHGLASCTIRSTLASISLRSAYGTATTDGLAVRATTSRRVRRVWAGRHEAVRSLSR